MTSEPATTRGSDPVDRTAAGAPRVGREFAAHLSRLQLERLVRAGAARTEPLEEELAGALLFLDTVGFTPLTERFAVRGRIGAEQIADVVRAYFVPLLDVIDQHGGDILHFAGDALLVFWAAAAGAREADALASAAACSLAAQQRLRAITPAHDSPLAFRASLGAGGVRALELGGLHGRWLQLITGEPLDEIREADRVAAADRVVVSERSLERLRACGARARMLGAGWFQLTGLERAPVPIPARELVMPPALDALLRGYVPRVVAERMTTDRAGLLGEFRRVTVMIANLTPARGRDADASRGLALLQEAVRAAQEEVERFEGEIDQLLGDEKGTKLIVAFGLPGSAHAEDPVRAVLAGRALAARLRALGLEPAIGIATGTVFCGLHGAPHRHHYTLLGSTINLAARLSDDAGATSLLCDDATRTAAARRIPFEPVGATTLKGFGAPVPRFTAGEPFVEPGPARSTAMLVGRAGESSRLDEALRVLSGQRRGGVVILEAEAGLGKSALLERFAGMAGAAGLPVFAGYADPLERGTAYFAFRPIVRGWLGITAGMDDDAARSRVLETLRASPDYLPLAPLLGSVLTLAFPDTELTAQMRGQVRAENLSRLLQHVARACLSQPCILTVEDVHWLDSASWSLLAALAREHATALFALSSRPGQEAAEEYHVLRRQQGTAVLALAPLTRDQTARIIAGQLGVAGVADDVTAVVAGRAEGNPFFIQEIVRSLRESGALRVVDGRCERGDGAASEPLPATLEGVITARIDRLPAAAQLTLKVAAVLGRAFDIRLLRAVHPTASSAGELDGWLEQLRAAELILPDTSDAEATHRFQHALTQEAAYGLLPFVQRRTHHRSAAEALERMYAHNVAPVQARIAHHFRMAELPGRAIPHLAGAGRQALDTYACREAVDFLRDALMLDRHERGDLHTDARRAEWSRLVAQAWYSLNQYGDAQEWYERAIRHSGWPVPSGGAGVVRALARLLAARARAKRADGRLAGEDRTLGVEAIRAMTELGTVHLWKGDQARWAHNALNMTRLADALGDSPESSFALIQFASLLTVVGLRRRADRESARAVAMAERSGDLLQIVSCNIGRGMIVTSQGRPLDGVEPLRRADAVAEDLRAGLWKHRSKFQLGEALLWLGRFEEAGRCYEEAAGVSLAAEPHVTGFATAMAACSLLHLGRVDDALALLEGPACLPYVRESPAALSIVCAFGVLADARLQAGDRAGALDAVQRAEAAITPRDDGTAGFFISVIGHSAIARVCLELARTAPGGDAAALAAQLDRTFARLRRIRRIHPGATARVQRLEAQRDLLRGRRDRARRRLRSSLAAAEAAAMPWEVALAADTLAELVPPIEREPLRARARAACQRMGLPARETNAVTAKP